MMRLMLRLESGQKVTSVEDDFLSVFAASREMVSAAQCSVQSVQERGESWAGAQ